MDARFHQDDLNALERRLAKWRPGADDLNVDAMLFAAGLAAGRRQRSRLVGPVMCGLLAALSAGLGVWGLSERTECQSLASRLRAPAPVASPSTPISVAAVPGLLYEPSPGDYLSIRRRIEQDPNCFFSSMQSGGPQVPGPPGPQPAILTPRQLDGLPVL